MESQMLVAHALRSEGADASEDGTGRGTPLVAFSVHSAHSCAKERHAFETDTAKSLDSTGGFASNQGGTVIAFHERRRENGRQLEAQEDMAFCLESSTHDKGGGRHQNVMAFEPRIGRNGRGQPSEVVAALRNRDETDTLPVVFGDGMIVRRLTPKECLRLQGFPDDWLDLDPPLSDSAKYRMIGNAVAVPVAGWIGNRILEQ